MTCSKSAVIAIVIGIAVGAQGATFSVHSGTLFDWTWTEMGPVGDGSEDLVAGVLSIVSLGHERPQAFDSRASGFKGITGDLHQQHSNLLSRVTPSGIDTVFATDLDPHFLLDGISHAFDSGTGAPSEDYGRASTEASDADASFAPLADMSFGSYLTTTLTQTGTVDDVWDLAHIVVPAGSTIGVNGQVASQLGSKDDVVDFNFRPGFIDSSIGTPAPVPDPVPPSSDAPDPIPDPVSPPSVPPDPVADPVPPLPDPPTPDPDPVPPNPDPLFPSIGLPFDGWHLFDIRFLIPTDPNRVFDFTCAVDPISFMDVNSIREDGPILSTCDDFTGSSLLASSAIPMLDRHTAKQNTTDELLKTFIADINGDLVVDVADLALVGSRWGTFASPPFIADINGDGIVDVADLALVGSQWGSDANATALSDGASVPVPGAAVTGAALLGLIGVSRRRRAA